MHTNMKTGNSTEKFSKLKNITKNKTAQTTY